MPNIFDEKGISVNNALDFRRMLNEEASVAFADKLDGKELKLDDSSVMGRIFATVSKALAQNAEILPLIFQSMDINTAQGKQLDNILWNLHRIPRGTASQAPAYLILHGDLGVIVPKGSVVTNSMTGDSFRTDANVRFTPFSANGVDIAFKSLDGVYELDYTVDGYLSTSPPIIVKKSDRETTVKQLADRFVDAVNSQSSYLSASRNNDNSVKVSITNEARTGNFKIKGNMNIVRSYVPVYATSVTYNSSYGEVGQINSISTPILGWRGVTNPYPSPKSRGVEDDEGYRFRGKLLQQSGVGKYNAIIMALMGVEGVTYQNIQMNTSRNETSSGITNNGLSITVMGGNEDDIALAIFDNISEGIATVGDIVKSVKDMNGFGHEIRFSRPVVKKLQISMSLITYPDFPSNGNARIKQAIVDWFNNLDVGEDIHYSRLYQPINSVSGFAVKNLKFGYKGGTLSMEDVIINHNEIATISAEDINIGGN